MRGWLLDYRCMRSLRVWRSLVLDSVRSECVRCYPPSLFGARRALSRLCSCVALVVSPLANTYVAARALCACVPARVPQHALAMCV